MPHVMNYPEIVAASRTGDVIYEEIRLKDRIRSLRFDGVDFVGVEDRKCYLMLIECDEESCPDYNAYYRCWNEMPTDEQRANIPWKDDPYKFLSGEEE